MYSIELYVILVEHTIRTRLVFTNNGAGNSGNSNLKPKPRRGTLHTQMHDGTCAEILIYIVI